VPLAKPGADEGSITMKTTESGYRPCACRDCFEIAIGEAGALCHLCEDAGCDPASECLVANDGPEECEDNACEGCPWCDAHGITKPLTLIHEACDRDGYYVVTEGTDHPVDVISALIRALVILDVDHRMTSTIKGPEAAVPEEALGDERHPFWDSPEARLVLEALAIALNALAPEGFIFMCEGEPTRLGFFR
jgi:hypothetical protein